MRKLGKLIGITGFLKHKFVDYFAAFRLIFVAFAARFAAFRMVWP